jgi:hypothetical protein
MAEGENDPIWGEPVQAVRIGPDEFMFNSDRSGRFQTDSKGLREYIRNWSPTDRAKISTWILDRNRLGEVANVDVPAIHSIEARSPLSVSDKIDRFLLLLDASGFRPGDSLPWGTTLETTQTVKRRHQTMLWIEAASDSEFYAFKDVIIDAGVLVADGKLRLGLKGFERLERLKTGGVESDQAFIAMWFDASTDAAFAQGIEPALAQAGYRSQRIDRKEHVNKIDDEIIAEIKRSRFMVADFTSGIISHGKKDILIARGGVYYEAGFAKGLGMEVIWTVRADQVDLVHFDTRQYNHITWSTPLDLRDKLYNRVAAVVGERHLLGRR